jgi:hypothetical protein
MKSIIELADNAIGLLKRYNDIYYDSVEVNIDYENSLVTSLERVDTSENKMDMIFEFEKIFLDFINRNEIYSYFYNQIEFKERNIFNKRFCNFCLMKKPDRTHHCRQCKKCYRRMDHHCYILGTCIGIGNHKFFFLTILYLFILLIFMAIGSFHNIYFYLSEYRVI